MLNDPEVMRAQHALLLKAIANRLEGEFGELFTRDTLQHYVDDSYSQLARGAKILNHIPAFVERFARHRLRALAKTSGMTDGHPVEVLFVCDRDDAVSQMATTLFAAAAGDRAERAVRGHHSGRSAARGRGPRAAREGPRPRRHISEAGHRRDRAGRRRHRDPRRA